jgi:hypothetical protein
MTYIEQRGVERGLRFIKEPLFYLSGVLLKKAGGNRRTDDIVTKSHSFTY